MDKQSKEYKRVYKELRYKLRPEQIDYVFSIKGLAILSDDNEIQEKLAETAAGNNSYYVPGIGFSWERTADLFKAFKDANFRRVV